MENITFDESIKNKLIHPKTLLNKLIDLEMKKEALYMFKNIKKIRDKNNGPCLYLLLFNCFQMNKEEVASELLKKYKNPEIDETIIMYAIDYNMEEVTLELLKRSKINQNEKDDLGKTILIQALEKNMKKVAKELLKYKKISYNDIDKNGNTALILACKNKI